MMLSPIGGPIGTPVLYALLLYRHHERIAHPRGADITSALQYRKLDTVLQPLQFLFRDYRPGRWWYEVLETLRRVALTGFLVVIDSELRLTMATALSFGSVLIHSLTTPYLDSHTNALANWCHVMVYVVLFFAQVLQVVNLPL